MRKHLKAIWRVKTKKEIGKLTSIDDEGHHIQLIPGEVKGTYKNLRTVVQFFLVLLFLIAPWIKIDSHPLILFNIASREFYLWGVLFKSHDAPLLFLLLITAVLGISFVTSLWGRIWCGWACPQTVFIDGVFRRIELLTEGNYLERRKIQNSPLTVKIFLKKSVKWALFFLISFLIAKSFLNLFAGVPDWMLWGLTWILLFNFSWFREQFCVVVCPYGRIQSVLLEPSSMAVVYDEKRTDCINCNRCVEVCPTGIDIRNGLQMDCIGCTACIDACNTIMKKVDKPKNLISYRTIDGTRFSFFKLKTCIHALLILIAITILVYNLNTRKHENIAIVRATEQPFSIVLDENGNKQILNHFKIHITNQTYENRTYRISLFNNSAKLITSENPKVLTAKSTMTLHVFISTALVTLSSDQATSATLIIENDKKEKHSEVVTLIGPT